MKLSDAGLAWRWLGALVLGVGVAGCSNPPKLSPEADAAKRVGLTEPIMFSVVGGPVDVAEADPSEVSFLGAIETRVRTSPEIQIAIADFRSALGAARQQRLLPNPVMSLVVRFPGNGNVPDIQAGLATDLIALLSRPGRIEAADTRLRAAAAEVERVVLDAVAEVQGRFVAAQTDDELLSVMSDRIAIVERLLSIGRSRLQAGEATRLDVIALESQRLGLISERMDIRLHQTEDRLALARLLGKPSSAAEWKLVKWTSWTPPELVEGVWIRAGLLNRPELRQQRFELAAYGVEVKLTRFTPFDGSDVGVDSQRDSGFWSTGPGVSAPLPVFDWGQARREQAEAAVSAAEHRLTLGSRKVVEEVRQAVASLRISGENLTLVNQELVPLAQRRLEQAEMQFRAGQVDSTALLQAEEQARGARTRVVELERQNAEAFIRLQRAVGGAAAMQAGPPARPDPATGPSTRP